jgi:hypothetical protein
MSNQPFAALEKASWLRRVLRVRCREGEYRIAYSGRSFVKEQVFVDKRLERQERIKNWFRPISRFYVGSHQTAIVLRVWPWLTIRSFHLLMDDQVLFCDHRQDLFDGAGPVWTSGNGAVAPASALGNPKGPQCPYCDRQLRAARLDLGSLPDVLARPDGPTGRPKAVFSFARRQRQALIFAGILAALAGIGLLAALFFVLDERIGFLGMLLLGMGPILVIHARKYRRLHAVVGSDGIALVENDAVSSCRWHEAQTVRESMLTGDAQTVLPATARGEDHYFQIVCRDGKSLVFRNFLDDLQWLGQIIQHETLPYLLPPALAALKNGEVLSFGPLSLDVEGLSAETEKRLSWDEVQDVKITNGLLIVEQVGKWRSWFKNAIGQIPNAHVLLALAERCRKGET